MPARSAVAIQGGVRPGKPNVHIFARTCQTKRTLKWQTMRGDEHTATMPDLYTSLGRLARLPHMDMRHHPGPGPGRFVRRAQSRTATSTRAPAAAAVHVHAAGARQRDAATASASASLRRKLRRMPAPRCATRGSSGTGTRPCGWRELHALLFRLRQPSLECHELRGQRQRGLK